MCHQSALSCSPSNPRGPTPTHSTRELLSVSILTSNFPSKQLRNPWVCAAPTHNQMLISRQTNTCFLGAPCLLGEETFINHFPSSCVLAARGKSREQRRDKGLTRVERQWRWCVESPGNHLFIQLVSMLRLQHPQEPQSLPQAGLPAPLQSKKEPHPDWVFIGKVDHSPNHSTHTATWSSVEFLFINVFISTFPINKPLPGGLYTGVSGWCGPGRGCSHDTNTPSGY